jgi:hypothetical protein
MKLQPKSVRKKRKRNRKASFPRQEDKKPKANKTASVRKSPTPKPAAKPAAEGSGKVAEYKIQVECVCGQMVSLAVANPTNQFEAKDRAVEQRRVGRGSRAA